jgi:hypothetical protein
VYQGSIQLVGLVGTYQEGLTYLQQQQQQQQQEAAAGGKGIVSPCDSCDSICTGSDEPVSLQLPAMHNLLLLETTSDADASAVPEASSSISSSGINLQAADARPGLCHHGSGSSSMSSSDWCVDISSTTAAAASAAAARAGEELYLTPAAAAAAALCPTAAPEHLDKRPAAAAITSREAIAGKVIMWLGSSIGNSTRGEAAAFLCHLKEAAMQPGRQWQLETVVCWRRLPAD